MVPAVLPKTLSRSEVPKTILTAFMLVTSESTIAAWDCSVNMEKVIVEGFYPMALFPRLLCKAVNWMQIVDRVSAGYLHKRLSSTEAQLSWGVHACKLSLSEAQGCIRIEISIQGPRGVMDQLQKMMNEVVFHASPATCRINRAALVRGRYLGREGFALNLFLAALVLFLLFAWIFSCWHGIPVSIFLPGKDRRGQPPWESISLVPIMKNDLEHPHSYCSI